MHRVNRFNLIDEPWIPIVGHGLASLRQVFTQLEYPAIGGNPIEKIALTKLLLAITQAAYTPADEEDWERNDSTAIAKHALAYLEKWHDRFWLYGEKPFLQMPSISKAKVTSFGSVIPHISTGNTTILSQIQVEKSLKEHEKALLILLQMGFALGGKKTDNSIILSPGYSGKRNQKGNESTGKYGTNLGYLGYLHSFLFGRSIIETLWLNLFTELNLKEQSMFQEGLGTPPWEIMPQGEDCQVAKSLRKSIMGRLIPLSRFCLLADDGLHYSEGISHLDYSEGILDPTVTFDHKKGKVLWVDPEKQPWRYLTSLLCFLDQNSTKSTFVCTQLQISFCRLRNNFKTIGLWAGGLRASGNVASEQKVTAHDDYVESIFIFPTEMIGEKWYPSFSKEMDELEKIAKILSSATLDYLKKNTKNDPKIPDKLSKKVANNVCHLYWQLCGRKVQELVNNCQNEVEMKNLRKEFVKIANKAYDQFCPKSTARQLDAWASNRPNFNKYLG